MTTNPLSAKLSPQTPHGCDGTTEARSAVPDRVSTPARGIRERVPGSADPTTLPYTCRCGARWTGQRTAHCAGQCHRTFTGVTTFDAHRRDGQCLNPADIGMTLIPGRAYDCWGTLGDQDER